MTDRELMQQALQALEFLSCDDEIDEALIVALRHRLEQPEQEPVAWADESALRWLADRKGKTSAHCTTQLSAARSCEQPMPIYTAPQRREWVGLTDEKITQVIDSMPNKFAGFMVDWDLYEFTRAIEAAHGIKEQNT